jgi:pimeloyl-ACP methyl ester carboxylesterase
MLIVPTQWHSPAYYDRVISILDPLGYKCVKVSMPSVGRDTPVASLDEDILAVREAVLKELDAGQDVVVNAHSWGGIPANSALDGLAKIDREKEGKKGVVKLTFVSAFVLSEGVSLTEAVGGGPAPWWIISEVSIK